MAVDRPELADLRRLDDAAIDRFYRDNTRRVLGWAIRLGGTRIDAEDAAHQVFEIALARLPGFRGDGTIESWLYGITRRVVANARRKAALWALVGLDTLQSRDRGAGPDELAERSDERRLFRLALDDLSLAQREVVVLVDLEERTAVQAAELLGLPVNTVYSRLHVARRNFGAALERHGLTSADTALARGGAR